MALLTVTGIGKKGEGDFLLSDISFTQKKNQKIAIAGETGSGKSTLLKIIAGLVQPDEGEVIFENERVKGPAATLVPGHPAIAYLSQDFELARFLRVEQVLGYANVLTADTTRAIFEICRISHLLTRKTDQLSGGERQRVAVARLLTSSPRLLLLDEPFSNLDTGHRNILKIVIDDICRRLKITCILVSHEPMDTLSWADRIIVMKDGQIVQRGKPEKIYRHPVDEYTAGLFGKYNLLTSDSAFFNLAGIKRNRKNLVIRPENLKIVSRKTKAVRGQVTGVTFFGSYYEIEVLASGTGLLVNHENGNFEAGDTVFVAISPASVLSVLPRRE